MLVKVLLDAKEEQTELALIMEEFIEQNKSILAKNQRLEIKLDALYKATTRLEFASADPQSVNEKVPITQTPDDYVAY